jgi:hypothetical protein
MSSESCAHIFDDPKTYNIILNSAAQAIREILEMNLFCFINIKSEKKLHQTFIRAVVI